MDVLITGLIFGAIYAVLACGFALVFGVARILNLAHTALYTIAAFCMYYFTVKLTFNPFLSAIVGIIGATIVALVVYMLCIDRVKHYEFSVLAITIAVAYIIHEILLMIFGTRHYGIPPLIKGSVVILGVAVTYMHLVTVAASLVALLFIWLLLWKTWWGIAIRAVSQDQEIAGLMGITVRRINLITVGISAAFAGLAGAVVAPVLMVYPGMWMPPLLTVLAAVVLGGLGSFHGAIVGAFILGLVEAAVVILVPAGAYLRGAAALVIMVIVLLVRSEGLFGVSFEEERL